MIEMWKVKGFTKTKNPISGQFSAVPLTIRLMITTQINATRMKPFNAATKIVTANHPGLQILLLFQQ